MDTCMLKRMASPSWKSWPNAPRSSLPFPKVCAFVLLLNKFHTQPAKHWFFGRKFVVLSAGKCVFFLFRDAFFPEEKYDDDNERL